MLDANAPEECFLRRLGESSLPKTIKICSLNCYANQRLLAHLKSNHLDQSFYFGISIGFPLSR